MAQNEKEAQRPDANGLARAAIGGDQAALLKLVELLRDDVYRLAKRMLGHPADAEDAAQEALIQIVTSLSSFRGESSVRTWAFRIASRHYMRFRVDDLFDEGERAAWRWTMTGTHKGKLGPVPASGRKVQVPGISIISLCEGRIVRDRVRADMVGLLAQIGAIASPST
jgi:predicted ester cyclase